MRFLNALLMTTGMLMNFSGGSAKPAVYQQSMSGLELLKHVLMHEKDWSLVLKERVKTLGPPPYGDRFVDAIIPREFAEAEPGLVELDTRAILSEVVYNYSTIGSFVEYASRAVHLSLTCYSMKHMAFQAHFLSRLIDKEADPGIVLTELGKYKENIVLFVDKLSIMPTDMELIFDTYWEVVRLMQYDIIDHVKYEVYPPSSKDHVDELYGKFLHYLNVNCTGFRLDREFFGDMGVKVDGLILDDVLNLVVDVDRLKRLGDDHAKFLSRYYGNLGIETMPSKLWGQLFYPNKSSPKKEELDEPNIPIVDHTNSDLTTRFILTG